MREKGWAFAAGLLLAGCAAATGSQSMMITGDTALITVSSHARETKASLLDRGLREAAAITSSQGYSYFVVLDAAQTLETVRHRRPGETLPNQNNPQRGTFSSSNLSATYLPGATYTTPDEIRRETRLTLDLTIRMYQAGGIDPASDSTCGIVALHDGARSGPGYRCNALK